MRTADVPPVLVDSGAFLALLDRKDAAHQASRRVLERLVKERAALFTTNFVRAEAYTLIGVRTSWRRARGWLRGFDLPLERILEADEARAAEILLRHEDKDYSYVDATSLAAMERLGARDAFTLDPHFRQFGFNIVAV